MKIQVMLADFGLATTQRLDDVDCGSLPYMSPETLACRLPALRVRYSTAHTDLWALSIVLLDLITAHNAWSSASSIDPCFAQFLHDRNSAIGQWLRMTLGISKSANAVLMGLLDPNPLCRTGLERVRKEVERVETFFRGREKVLFRARETQMEARKEVSPESESRDGVARRHGVYPPSSGSFEACMLGGEELPRKAAISGYGYALEHHGRVVVNVAKYMSLFGV